MVGMILAVHGVCVGGRGEMSPIVYVLSEVGGRFADFLIEKEHA